MNNYDGMQDSELEMFYMNGDRGIKKETLYDRSQDLDTAPDLIDAPDPAHLLLIQHSTSVPVISLSFSSTWPASLSNEFYGHSLKEPLECFLNLTDHVHSNWSLPVLQSGSHGSSTGTEPLFEELGRDSSAHGIQSPSPSTECSPFLSPSQSPSQSSSSYPGSNASPFAAAADDLSPTIERFGPLPISSKSSNLAFL